MRVIKTKNNYLTVSCVKKIAKNFLFRSKILQIFTLTQKQMVTVRGRCNERGRNFDSCGRQNVNKHGGKEIFSLEIPKWTVAQVWNARCCVDVFYSGVQTIILISYWEFCATVGNTGGSLGHKGFKIYAFPSCSCCQQKPAQMWQTGNVPNVFLFGFEIACCLVQVVMSLVSRVSGRKILQRKIPFSWTGDVNS